MNVPALPTPQDLHTHSRASDGAYSPTELVEHAAASGIRMLALTDHDTTAGLTEARQAAQQTGIQVISGVEISVTWEKKVIHLVALNVNPDQPDLRQGLTNLQTIRQERAREMGQRLAKAGIPGLYEATSEMAGEGMITRTHFGHLLVRLGLAADMRDVFNRYLTPGKPGYVSTQWATLEDAIRWSQLAGGITVMAHPQRYNLTKSWMRRLLGEFQELGGEGLEVLSGTAPPGEVQASAELAKRYNLLASCGSDFHNPAYSWPKLGRLPAMPRGLTPVWEAFDPQS